MEQSSPLLGLIGIAVAIFFMWLGLRELRRRKLMKKYDDAPLVDRLMRKEIWEGQTEAQLIDSRGFPLATDRKVLKTKTTETWKYKRIGRGQYAERIFVENGVVIGWKTNAR